MDERLKERLVGAAVLVSLAVIFVPMVLEGPVREAPAPRAAPPPPQPGFSSQIIPLGAPATPLLDEDRARREARAEAPEPVAEPSPERAVQGRPAPAPAEPPPAAQAAPRAPPGAPAAGLESWAVQLGSFSNAANAAALRDRLRRKGYDAYLETVRGKRRTVTRVYVGPELERAAARRLRDRLFAETRLKGLVVRYTGD